jgi:hypothetical protein
MMVEFAKFFANFSNALKNMIHVRCGIVTAESETNTCEGLVAAPANRAKNMGRLRRS